MFDVRVLNVSIELWGVAFCIIGIASTFLLVSSDVRYRDLLAGAFFSELFMAGGDALAGVFRGAHGALGWMMTHAGNLVGFVGGFALVGFITGYLCMRAEEAGRPELRRWGAVVSAASAAMCVLALLGLFYYIDEANLYHRSDWYWIGQAFVLVVSAANAVLLWRCRHELGRSAASCLIFFSLLPALSSLAQIAVYGINFNAIASALGMVVVFLEMQQHSSRILLERTEELAAARVEASESRIAVMVSQIQPHFLFNALDTIYGLVDEDPEKAKGAIASFSRYLRTNLDSLNHLAPVPIEREMDHVRTYLELERASDESRLEYVMDVHWRPRGRRPRHHPHARAGGRVHGGRHRRRRGFPGDRRKHVGRGAREYAAAHRIDVRRHARDAQRAGKRHDRGPACSKVGRGVLTYEDSGGG